jgi:ABC-type polysaccharide/polyol phosphate export permease
VPAIESIRYAFFGVSLLEPWHVIVSAAVSVAVLFFGIALFNRAEQTAMDTV